MRLGVVSLALALAACGGGGGSKPPPVNPPPPPSARTTPIAVGYFWTDGDQIARTYDHISFIFTPDGGDWTAANYDTWRITTTILQMQEAKARGVDQAWVACGFLVFDKDYHARPDGIARLLSFKAQLDALGLTSMVKVLYPVDEPETIRTLDEGTLTSVVRSIKAAWPGPKLAVIYGGTSTYKGRAAYDLIGRDDYGAGADVLNRLPPLDPGQQWIIVPGGADPWRQDPTPFVEFAKVHPQVFAIVPFIFVDGYGGTSYRGIGNNGMLPAYRAAGCTATGKCAPPT